MNTNKLQLRNEFISDIKDIIETAKTNAIRSVDFQRVIMYWRMGERIVVEEQQGSFIALIQLCPQCADTIQLVSK